MAGDIVTAWTQGDIHRNIESPFDLIAAEEEFGPRGPVTLEGLRGTQKQQWELGLGKWGIGARPEMSTSLLDLYNEAGKSTISGSANAANWQKVTAALKGCHSDLLEAWMEFHAGEALADTKHWSESDKFYSDAANSAQNAGLRLKPLLLLSWAEKLLQRNDFDNAEKYYREALQEAKALNTTSFEVARGLNGLGAVAENRGNLDEAEHFFREASEIREALAPNSLIAATSLNNLGYVALDRGDLDKAEELLKRGLSIREKLAPDSLDVASSYNNLGIMAYQRGQLAVAEAYYRKALVIREKLAPGTHDVAAIYNNLGNIADDRGDVDEAERCYRHTLEIDELIAPDSLNVAASLNNIGLLAKDRGDLVEAEQYLQKSLDLRKKHAPGSLAVADSLSNMGLIADARDEFDKAEKYHRQALAIREKKAPGSLAISYSLTNLGFTANNKGDLAHAEEGFRQALAIIEKQAPDSLDLAMALNNVGSVAHDRGDMTEAEHYLREALDLLNKVAPGSDLAGETDSYLGDIAWKHGDLTGAEAFYRRALEMREKLSPDSVAYAESLAQLGSLMRGKGQNTKAGELFQKAIDVFESQTAHLGGSTETRSSFRAEHRKYYQQYVDLLMSQGKPGAAFEVLERSRAQTFLEMLNEARIDPRAAADSKLLQQERALQVSLRVKIQRRIESVQNGETDDSATESREIDSLLVQYNDLEGRIRTASPAYASLTRPQALSVKAVQQLLDGDTLLLEYALGQEKSYVFAVTADTLQAFDLPKEEQIDAAARRVHSVLSRQGEQSRGDLQTASRTQLNAAEGDYQTAARKLSEMVFGPVEGLLGGKRLVIVSDGALQYVPFAALPYPDRRSRSLPEFSNTLPAPLILQHEIVSLPSASVLAVLRQQQAQRGSTTNLSVAVLADPVFDSTDVRVTHDPHLQRAASRATISADERIVRSAAEVGLRSPGEAMLPRLAFSRREAHAIMALAEPGEGFEALDFQASRETALSPELAKYRVVHFATHGLLDNRHPELSGLVLSMVDRHGKPQNGFLDLQDIYNLRLSADLVVLSACETALGKEIGGEGLEGLTRGFMYAGAPRVIASLWKVDDVATAELMARFYREMLKKKETPAAALRDAQLSMQKQGRWKNPYFWAAFTLQGDWK